ncbi:MAG: polymorphic toxin-type HINT domain-containing protein [Gemmataceae bacterium]
MISKDAAPALLDLAASQLGLGKLKTQVQRTLNFVPDQINKVLRASVAKIVKRVNVRVHPAYFGAIQQVDKDAVSYAGKTYHLFAIKDSKGKATIKLVDASGLLHRDRSFLLTRADFPTQHQGVFDAYLAAAQALANGSKAAKGASPRKPTPNVPDNALTQHNALLKAADDARKLLRDTINAHGCKILLAGCFAAGTKLLAREGWRAVETLREGDEVATRPEHDVYGTIAFKPIEEVFVRTGRVLHLHLSDGQLIRTTPEHPFWVEHEGWQPADVLKAGMRLATLGGEWVAVEEAFDTGEYETVYNCRVAEWHTSFVGDEAHVTAVWAHNAYASFSGLRVAEDVKNHAAISSTIQKAINDQIVQKGAFGDQAGLTDALKKIATDNAGAADLQSLLETEISKQLEARNVQKEREAFYKSLPSDFASVINNRYSGRDGANKTYPGEYRTLTGGATSTYKTHAHHVVFKIGIDNKQKKLVLQSQNILLYWGIDPFYGQENLFWAPNKGHSARVLQDVYDELDRAKSSHAKVVQALKDLAIAYINGPNNKGQR